MDKEILWNIVNSILGGVIFFLGAISDGNITWNKIGLSLIPAAVIAFTKFQQYWMLEEEEYKNSKLFKFL